jgi:hypothetical protein
MPVIKSQPQRSFTLPREARVRMPFSAPPLSKGNVADYCEYFSTI